MTIAALEQALTFTSRTDLIASARQQPLPTGITEVLKICSGDKEVLLAAQERSRHSQDDLRHAAEFYVQQILFASESDHYRILGVDPDDAEARIKLHYRLLVRWLHPDKNAGDWEAVFSERINRAWHALRTPERRREYDDKLSSEKPLSQSLAIVSSEPRPAEWRDRKSDARFMSSRTIKQLPVFVFSLLGVGALLALWLFSQTQPQLQAPVANTNKVDAEAPIPQGNPIESSVKNVETALEGQSAGVLDTVADSAGEVKEAKSDSREIPKSLASVSVAPPTKSTAESPPTAVKKPVAVILTTQTKKTPVVTLPLPAGSLATMVESENKPKGKRTRKTRVGAPDNTSAPAEIASLSSANAVVNKSEEQKNITNEASVRQFLQRFSRVYSEGDYYALHNMFTNDLSILGAPPQRSVLRSYRKLFENSETRVIALNHVSWLVNDDNIVVIASYQAEVLPRGKAETQASQGDIRLDLRMENGQLKIIRLQSDAKNG
jgi:hypothetical protein